MKTMIFNIFQANGAKSEQNLLVFYKTLFFFSIILLLSVLIIEGFYLLIHFQRYVQLKMQTIRVKQSLGVAPAKIVYELFKEHFLLLIFCSILGFILENAITKILLSKLPKDIIKAFPNYIGFFSFLYILFILVMIILTFCLTKRNLKKNYSSL
ncbi:MAG: FtsX-like permease family protein [Lactobacillales bacterium]|nr:FtsX-like permease family protein [Lactobacillales bacterium]